MTTHYFNPQYVGMTDAEKQKTIKLNYYNSKGKMKNAISVRCKRFGFDKELFIIRKATYAPRKK